MEAVLRLPQTLKQNRKAWLPSLSDRMVMNGISGHHRFLRRLGQFLGDGLECTLLVGPAFEQRKKWRIYDGRDWMGSQRMEHVVG